MSRHADDVWVAGQVAALTALVWPGRARWRLPGPVTAAALAASGSGAALAAAGAAAHGRTLTPSVTPPAAAVLLTGGPYAASRNPVYAGLLLAAAGTAVLRRRTGPVLAWAALLLVLQVKVRLEERRLTERFGLAYLDYAADVPRFVGTRSLRVARRTQPGPAGHGTGRRP